MKHEILFGVPLFRYHLDPTEIKELIEKKYKDSDGLPLNETPGGWDCTIKTDFDISTQNIYTPFYDDIMKQFSIDVGLESGNGKAMIHESWSNYYNGGMNQEEHDHLPSFYSGIHYIKFHTDHEAVHLMNPLFQLYSFTYSRCRNDDALSAHPFSKQFECPEVKEGDIIIFPSFIRHRVNGVTSEEPRISVAFNINTIEGSTRRVFSQC